jgi:glutaredoxin
LKEFIMRTFILFALIVGGGWYWHSKNYAPVEALDESGRPAVLVVTFEGCGAPCQGTLSFMRERGVPFSEKRLNTSNEESDEVKYWRNASGNIFPFTLVGDAKVRGHSKSELVGALGNKFDEQYLIPDERRYFKRHFDANGAPMVVLYGTAWCGYCAALRKDLRENGVNFVDIDVEKSGEFERLTHVMDIPGYPAVWVGYNRVRGTRYSDVKAAMN